MTTPQLDPNPQNELGKGILDPDHEADLLARGYIFAAKVPAPDLPFGIHIICKRRLLDAVLDGELVSPRFRRRPVASSIRT